MQAQSVATNQKANDDLMKAIAFWKEVVGPRHITTSPDVLDRYSLTCGHPGHRPIAVLYPHLTWEVRQILAIATELCVPVHPISRGRNWGYGSAAAPSAGTVILDLSRMNRIIEVSDDFAYAVIEPGVTQEDLYKYLAEHHPNLRASVTGAPPDASIIGNTIERGYGFGFNSDQFSNSCSLEVVLPDGRVLQTGYGHYPTARTASLFKSGLGPFLDGIFTQSNFGVVTRATIWLQRESPYLGVALVQINSDKSIAKAFNRIRNLKLEGRLKGPVRFANNNRMLSCFTQRPVSDAQSPEQLNQSLQRLCKKWGVKCWNGVIGLQGERSEVRLQVKTLKRELGPLASIQFCSNRMLNLALRFESLYKLFTGCDLKQKSALFNLLKGQPTIGPTLGAYWRKSFAPEARDFDPPRDGCGLIWCCPIIPLGEYDVLQLLSTTRATCAKHGLETNLALLPIDERSACCTVGLIYNRDNSEEQTAALECHDALLSRYMKHGYIPYRFGAHISESAAGLFDPNDTYWQVCNSIKEALDPAGILSPGRYGLGKAANSEHA